MYALFQDLLNRNVKIMEEKKVTVITKNTLYRDKINRYKERNIWDIYKNYVISKFMSYSVTLY